MQSRFHWIFRVFAGMATALLVGQAHAQHAHCSYGWQDSSCVTPVYRAAQTPPTCSTDPGWTTVAAAQWIGSRFSAPQCAYQAPPSCPADYDQESSPVWNGLSWVGLACIPRAPAHLPPTAICASAASSGTIMVMGGGFSRRYVAASQFTQYTAFSAIQRGGAATWQWPTYSMYDYFITSDIGLAVEYLQLPQSTQTTNAWYAATYTGPDFPGDTGTIYNSYLTFCSIDPSGNLAGIIQMPASPPTSLDE